MKTKWWTKDILAEMAMLYEISLAAGRSLELESCCDQFLRVLLARRNLSHASVWLHERLLASEPRHGSELPSMHCRLVYAYPAYRTEQTRISYEHPLYRQVERRAAFSVDATHPEFRDFMLEAGVERGGGVAGGDLDDLHVPDAAGGHHVPHPFKVFVKPSFGNHFTTISKSKE